MPVVGGLGAIRPDYWVVLMLTELASVKGDLDTSPVKLPKMVAKSTPERYSVT